MKKAMKQFLLSQHGKEVLVDGFENPSTDLGGNAQYGITVIAIGDRDETITTRYYSGYRDRIVYHKTTIIRTVGSCDMHTALLFYAQAQEKRLGWGKKPLIKWKGIPVCPEGAYMLVPSWHTAY